MDMDIPKLFPSWLLPTTLLFFFPFIFMYTIRRKSSSTAKLKLPPGPTRFPIIGNLHNLLGKDSIHQTMKNLSRTYGPAMLLHFGSQPILVISSTEMATEVLKTNDQKMCTRPYSKATKRLSFNYMDAAFGPHNDHWRDMRKVLVSEFLGAKRIGLYKNVMVIEMEGLVRSLSSLSSSTAVNLDEVFYNLVSDAVCKVAFGKSYREKTFNSRTIKEIIAETVVLFSTSFSDIFPTYGWILDRLSGWDHKLEKCFHDFDGFLQMILDDHLDQNEAKRSDREKDFVDDCISRLTRDEMKALLGLTGLVVSA